VTVSTEWYAGGFYGTSASAPHVTGAAALVLEAFPSFSPAQVQSWLEARALDLGDVGRDNLYGAGRLSLGKPPSAY
jgi:subtilisin family serine protease